jgi:hypothetical protein
MIDLTINLDDGVDFETLFERGRSLIPTLAPDWTDHNTSDPGIMLLELMAWIADAQIYSLARLRHDERQAYARFIGARQGGPRPAQGLLWPRISPDGTVPWTIGTLVSGQTDIVPDVANAVTFYPAIDLQLTAARPTRVYSRLEDGTVRDWTRVNAQPGVTFRPFGIYGRSKDTLLLDLSGAPVGGSDSTKWRIAIGFEVVSGSTIVAGGDDVTVSPSRGVRVRVKDSAGIRPVTVVADTTNGLLTSGVVVLGFDSRSLPVDEQYTLMLSAAGQALLVPPRVGRIALNVLPITQAEPISEKVDAFGTGIADQTYTLQKSALMWNGGAAVSVQILEGTSWVPWTITSDLGTCDPTDRVFILDTQSGTLTFGNGINGMMPPLGAALLASYWVSAGSAGNLQEGLDWSLPVVVAGSFGSNSEAVSGGADATSLDDLRRTARQSLQISRPIVTSDDLTAAVLSFSDLRVVRALELPPASSQLRGTRVLVAAVGRDADTASAGTLENPDWLEEIRSRLAPRLSLGQALHVIAPTYVLVNVTATLVATPNMNPATVAGAAQACLQSNLAIVSGGSGNTEWPFGRELTPLAIKGWLRALPGVAKVSEVRLSAAGKDTLGKPVVLGATGLPLLQLGPTDIVVQRWPGTTA